MSPETSEPVKRKHPGGRPSKLSTDIQEKIRQYILADNYFDVSCIAAGVTFQTGYNWLQRGEKEYASYEAAEAADASEVELEQLYTAYAEFWFVIRQAEAQAEIADIAFIKSGGKEWTSRAWIRERRSKERWGRKDYQEVKVLGTIGVKAEDLSDDELVAIIKRQRSSGGTTAKKEGTE